MTHPLPAPWDIYDLNNDSLLAAWEAVNQEGSGDASHTELKAAIHKEMEERSLAHQLFNDLKSPDDQSLPTGNQTSATIGSSSKLEWLQFCPPWYKPEADEGARQDTSIDKEAAKQPVHKGMWDSSSDDESERPQIPMRKVKRKGPKVARMNSLGIFVVETKRRATPKPVAAPVVPSRKPAVPRREVTNSKPTSASASAPSTSKALALSMAKPKQVPHSLRSSSSLRSSPVPSVAKKIAAAKLQPKPSEPSRPTAEAQALKPMAQLSQPLVTAPIVQLEVGVASPPESDSAQEDTEKVCPLPSLAKDTEKGIEDTEVVVLSDEGGAMLVADSVSLASVAHLHTSNKSERADSSPSMVSGLYSSPLVESESDMTEPVDATVPQPLPIPDNGPSGPASKVVSRLHSALAALKSIEVKQCPSVGLVDITGNEADTSNACEPEKAAPPLEQSALIVDYSDATGPCGHAQDEALIIPSVSRPREQMSSPAPKPPTPPPRNAPANASPSPLPMVAAKGLHYTSLFPTFEDFFIEPFHLKPYSQMPPSVFIAALQKLLVDLGSCKSECGTLYGDEEAEGDEAFGSGLLCKIQRTRSEVYSLILGTLVEDGLWREIDGPMWNLWWSWNRPLPRDAVWLAAQKANHIPKSKELTHKDLLKRNVFRYARGRGQGAMAFQDLMPLTFVLPTEYVPFTKAYGEVRGSWIMKVIGQSRGRGITIINKLEKVAYSEPVVIQRYVDRPLLLDGHKFDMRLFVVVTQFSPLECFVSTLGFARLASIKYDPATIDDKFAHITNTSISRECKEASTSDGSRGASHHREDTKWLLDKLASHLDKAKGKGAWEGVWRAVTTSILRTLACAEDNIPYNPCCFELFGFDILLDEQLHPWVLEVNASPAMDIEGPEDEAVKPTVIKETVELLQLPPINREALIEVAGARLNALTARRHSQRYTVADTEAHIGAILNDTPLRRYGEMPKAMGHFQRLAPSPDYDLTLRQKKTSV